jgi:hypothetical protein
MRRDSNDKEWKDVKQRVFKRDRNHCRLFNILTFKETLIFQKINNNKPLNLDPAHILEVSLYPQYVYEDCNIVTLNRTSHEFLDSCRDPITGQPITKEERNAWWKKILGKQWDKLVLLPGVSAYFNV